MSKINKRGGLSSQVSTALSELAAKGGRVFPLASFAHALGHTRVRASKLLHQLQRSGWVIRLAQGKYLMVPLEAGPRSAWSEDSLVVASHLAAPAAVAYWSACHHWNWTEQVPRTIFVQTTQRVKAASRTVLGVRYRFVRVQSGKFFGTIARTVGNGQIMVTQREKTLVDALDRPDLCGGITQVGEILPVAGQSIDWNRFDSYLKQMDSGAIYKRLGFLAEHLGGKLAVPNRSERIESWRSRLTGGVALLEPHRPAQGLVNSRWRVRINISLFVGEER